MGMLKESRNRTKRAAFIDESMSKHPAKCPVGDVDVDVDWFIGSSVCMVCVWYVYGMCMDDRTMIRHLDYSLQCRPSGPPFVQSNKQCFWRSAA